MRITEITLTNFRSFQATQSIALAPVTLLFGPNSVGKSSVLMALFYIQQMLEKGQCDPQRIDALGEKHIGGFKSLVNGRDLAKRMHLSTTYWRCSTRACALARCALSQTPCIGQIPIRSKRTGI